MKMITQAEIAQAEIAQAEIAQAEIAQAEIAQAEIATAPSASHSRPARRGPTRREEYVRRVRDALKTDYTALHTSPLCDLPGVVALARTQFRRSSRPRRHCAHCWTVLTKQQ